GQPEGLRESLAISRGSLHPTQSVSGRWPGRLQKLHYLLEGQVPEQPQRDQAHLRRRRLRDRPCPRRARAAAAFRNDVLPAWRGRSIHDIARRDVIALLEQIAADRPILANRVKGVLSKFFGWLCERDVIAASPCVGVKSPSPEVARDRVLNDD